MNLTPISMKKQNCFHLIFLFFLLFIGCQSQPEDFTLSYSMESIRHYKVILTVDSKQHYLIEEYNYFFDNFEKKQEPQKYTGTLTDEEYKAIIKLIRKNDLLSLKEAYGFEEANPDLGDFLYQTLYKTGGKEKSTSVRTLDDPALPTGYTQLLTYLNRFISEHKK